MFKIPYSKGMNIKLDGTFFLKAKPAPVLDSPDHLPIFEDQLLDGLQNWMDRLFEGTTYRYRKAH